MRKAYWTDMLTPNFAQDELLLIIVLLGTFQIHVLPPIASGRPERLCCAGRLQVRIRSFHQEYQSSLDMNRGLLRKLRCRHQSLDTIRQNDPRSSEPYGVADPPPLSPIEELEDDFHIPRPESKPESIPTASAPQDPDTITLERRSQLLFSRQHLELILAHTELSSRFTSFLRTYRPDSVPLLVYLLDSVKALKAIRYAEAIIRGLEPVSGFEFTTEANGATMSWVIEDKADRALEILVKDDLPAFIAYIYVRTVDLALVSKVTRKEVPASRGLADGLAEVFVLSDPAQPDNPIVFASEGMDLRYLCSQDYSC